MKKVAIVGVEGSGKTVLMAVIGERYRKPREDGLFLYAKSLKTIEYCNAQVEKLRSQNAWPDSTAPDALVNLEWTLMRRGGRDSRSEEVCSIQFLDFAGEVYRCAFGDMDDEASRIKRESYRNQIEAIKAHLKEAESIVVLVNLSDIINTRGLSKKASEMDWLSQRIFEFAVDETSAKHVAVAFTQKDLYEPIIAGCGGLEGVFAEYLPSVFYRYESMITPFAISAVNKTIPGEDGRLLPDPGFESEGLDALFSWMSGNGKAVASGEGNEPETENGVSSPVVSDELTEVFLKAYREGRYEDAAAMKDSVDKDAVEVAYTLGVMYDLGRGVAEDKAEAVRCYRRAAEQGHAKAQNNLGYAYDHGEAVAEDKAEAVKWYRKAAEHGNATAQFNLGYAYDHGGGVAEDKAEAIKWYRKAAEQGYAIAQLYIENATTCRSRLTKQIWMWIAIAVFVLLIWLFRA